MTHEQAIATWTVVGAAHSGGPLSEAELEIRAELISDLDFAAAKRAVLAHAQEWQWLPSVAELRAAVLRPGVPEAATAWAEVCAYVASHGWPTPPGPEEFSHPAVFEALRGLGAWDDFCAGDLALNRAHFLRVYPAVRDRARRDELVAPAFRAPIGAGAVRELTTGPLALGEVLHGEIG